MAIPLTVGITGHRDPVTEDVGRLSSQVTQVVAGLRAAFPSTPLVFLSALASGADRIAARAALGCDGVSLVATLPMPVRMYEDDFTEAELGEFRELIECCSEVIVVGDDSMTRNARYQACSRFVALNSHTLIAMWNGQAPELVGGTADTVYYKVPSATPLPDEQGRPSVMTAEPGVTIWLPTRRISDKVTAPLLETGLTMGGPLLLSAEVVPVPWRPKADVVAQRVAELNVLGRRFGPVAGSPQAPDGSRGGDQWTEWLYLTADAIAVNAQRWYRRATRLLLTAGLVLLLAYDTFTLTPSPMTALLHLAGVTGVIGAWVAMTRSGVRDRFQQMRALAEGARIQQVWTDVGLDHAVSDSFLPGQTRAEWIRRVLRTARLLDSMSSAAPLTEDEAMSEARTWIGDQVRYFYGDGRRLGAIRRNRARAQRLLAFAGLGIGLALFTVIPPFAEIAGEGAGRPLTITIGLLWTFGLGLAFAFTAYEELMGYWSSAQWYSVSAANFRAALGELDRIEGLPAQLATTRDLVGTLGQQALTENGYWLALSQATTLRPV